MRPRSCWETIRNQIIIQWKCRLLLHPIDEKEERKGMEEWKGGKIKWKNGTRLCTKISFNLLKKLMATLCLQFTAACRWGCRYNCRRRSGRRWRNCRIVVRPLLKPRGLAGMLDCVRFFGLLDFRTGSWVAGSELCTRSVRDVGEWSAIGVLHPDLGHD